MANPKQFDEKDEGLAKAPKPKSPEVICLEASIERLLCGASQSNANIVELKKKLHKYKTYNRSSNITLEEKQSEIEILQRNLVDSTNRNKELQKQLEIVLQTELAEGFDFNLHITQEQSAQKILQLEEKVRQLIERLEWYEPTPASSLVANRSHNVARIVQQPITLCTPLNYDHMWPGGQASGSQHDANIASLEKEIRLLRVQLEGERGNVRILQSTNRLLADDLSNAKTQIEALKDQIDFYCANLECMDKRFDLQKHYFEIQLEKAVYDLNVVERERDVALQQVLDAQDHNNFVQSQLNLQVTDDMQQLENLEAIRLNLANDLYMVGDGFQPQ